MALYTIILNYIYYYKFDEVKLGNKINHFDKYRREMCAEAVTAIVKRLTKCH